jgi:hypothetical protein
MKKNALQITLLMTLLLAGPSAAFSQDVPVTGAERARTHHEVPDQPYKAPDAGARRTPPVPGKKSPGFFTKQVNVDASGNNIPMDAANEPNLAVDPTDPNKMVIGWRQFDNNTSNFRQAGYAYTSDGGQTWTFPGVIDPQVFRSDPIVDFDSAGTFYYNSLTNNSGLYTCKVYKSQDGGATWDAGTEAHGGDKQCMTIDRSGGPGEGNIYSSWTQYYSSCPPEFFTRSTNGGSSYEDCIYVANYPFWGTMAVGPDGELYVAGTTGSDGISVTKSVNAMVPGSIIQWDFATTADVDGYITSQVPVNPVGLLGQAYVDVDCSSGPGRGNVYVLASVHRLSNGDPGDVMFARSTDGWLTWEPPVRINTDVSTTNFQWFGTMSVAPNGRIDVVWLDTRDAPAGTYNSALYYCYSSDQGETWSINKRISEPFNPQIGYPQQDKMGDYFDMVSDNEGAHLAWANTLNGEEDVYYTHITPTIVGLDDKGDRQVFSLSCQPNPFRDHARVSYSLGESSSVKLVICDLSGRVVATLAEGRQAAGSHTVRVPEGLLSDGFYFCRLSAGAREETTRLIKLKQ